MSYHPQIFNEIGVRGWTGDVICSCAECKMNIYADHYFTIQNVNGDEDHGVFCSVACTYKHVEYYFPIGGSDDE